MRYKVITLMVLFLVALPWTVEAGEWNEVYWDTGDFKAPMPGDLTDLDSILVLDTIWHDYDSIGIFKPNDTTVFDLPLLQWKDQFGRTWELAPDSTPIWDHSAGYFMEGSIESLNGNGLSPANWIAPKIIGWEPKLVFRLVEEEKP